MNRFECRMMAAACAAALTVVCASARELGYMSHFTDEEAAQSHVVATSYTLPHDFVDGQWQGIITASDGKTYFSVSSHAPDNNAQFYRYDPASDTIEHLADVGVWCGYGDSPGNYNAQGKIHSNLYEFEGKLYGTTTSAHHEPPSPYAGGHFLAYDLATGALENLGMVPCADGKWGLLAGVFDPVYRRLYGMHQMGTLHYFDLDTRAIVEVGRIEDGTWQCRGLIVDDHGVLYGSTHDGMIYRYDPATDVISCLLTRVPYDPEWAQPKGPSGRPNDWAWAMTRWGQMERDPATGWWYGLRGNDEYLFRFRPPADPKQHVGEVEGLGVMAYPGKPSRHGSLGLAILDRTLYYVSYPVWAPMAHLMSYHLDSGAITHHGPIIVEGNRRVSEIQALEAGADGTLHGVAMVWSIEGEDPANPWANRAQCYFHARFVRIDPQGVVR